jgi:hypothetical protein
MAKTKAKAKTLAEMTPTELVEFHAKNFATKSAAIKALTKELEATKTFLADFYKAQGFFPGTTAHGIKFVEKQNPPSLTGPTGKLLEHMKGVLLSDLPKEYRQEVINVGLLAATVSSNAAIRALVEKHGFEIKHTKSITFKVVGESDSDE